MTLEELIRDMATRGELTHMSITPRNGVWEAVFCAGSTLEGYTTGTSADPVDAMRLAIVNTKIKRRRVHPVKPLTVTVADTPKPEEPPTDPFGMSPLVLDGTTAEDFLPKVQPRAGDADV